MLSALDFARIKFFVNYFEEIFHLIEFLTAQIESLANLKG